MTTSAKRGARMAAKPKPRNGFVKLSDFQPQRKNVNKGKPHGLAALDSSIRRDGFSAPMVAAKDGEVFAGSMPTKRARAAKPKAKKREPNAKPLTPVDPTRPLGKSNPSREAQFQPGNQAAVGHGRPRKMQDLKELILETLAEDLTDANGHRLMLTRAQAMIRTMLIKSPTDRIALLEYAFGAVPKPTREMNEDEWRDWLKQNGKDPDQLIAEFVAHMGSGGDRASSGAPAGDASTGSAGPAGAGDDAPNSARADE